MGEQARGELREYIADDIAGPYMRLGKGFTSMAGNMNPQEVTRTYIDDSTSTVTTGFQPEWPVEGNIYTGDPANELLYEKTWHMAKGDDAIVYLVRVQMWEDGTINTDAKKSKRYMCNWAPASDGGGAGGEDNTFSGSLKAKGDPVYGESEIAVDTGTGFETCDFTPD